MEERKITIYAEDFSDRIWREEYCEPLGLPENSKAIEITIKDVKVIY